VPPCWESGLHSESPPETTKLRLLRSEAICFAPNYVAEPLLRSEGFTELEYVQLRSGAYEALAAGELDFTPGTAGQSMMSTDRGDPVVMLTGLHPGCYELFVTDRVRSVRDLKGKRVSVTSLNTGRHVFLASMLAYWGLNAGQDVELVQLAPAESISLLAEGKIDGFMAFPPEPLELKERKIGRVLVDTLTDRPWSQYFCCMMSANCDFVRKHPVATKRALRAFLKAADICALEPERAAQFPMEKRYTARYDQALLTMKALPYGHWRTIDPTDTVRFFALRAHEAGMIKSSPQQITAQGTDWRFLNELKKELKG
jgi:NitT/TauT family transport system substrate-binding protein